MGVKSVNIAIMDIVTTKIERDSLRKLKIIAAIKKERMTDVLLRLIDNEFEEIQGGSSKKVSEYPGYYDPDR